jgi:hypothetical protein
MYNSSIMGACVSSSSDAACRGLPSWSFIGNMVDSALSWVDVRLPRCQGCMREHACWKRMQHAKNQPPVCALADSPLRFAGQRTCVNARGSTSVRRSIFVVRLHVSSMTARSVCVGDACQRNTACRRIVRISRCSRAPVSVRIINQEQVSTYACLTQWLWRTQRLRKDTRGLTCTHWLFPPEPFFHPSGSKLRVHEPLDGV